MRCLVVLWHRCGGGVERHGTAPLVGCTGKTMRGPLGVPEAEAQSKAWTIALALASPGTCTCAWRSCNPLRQPIAVVGGTECPSDTPRAHMLWAVSLDHSVRPAARDIIGTAMRRWPALLPSDTSHAPPLPSPQRLRDMPSGCGSFTGPWTVPRSSVSRAASGHCRPPIGRQPRPPRGPSGPQASAPQHNPQQTASRGLRCNSASQTAPSAGHHHRQGPPSGSHTTR